MKKISVWANRNISKARLIIILIHLKLALLGILTGWLLFKVNLIIPSLAIYLALLVYVLAFTVYPQRGNFYRPKNKHKIYVVQKSCDFTLAFCAFLMISFFSRNYFDQVASIPIPLVNPVFASKGDKPTAEEILNSLKYRSRNELTRSEKKILKHEFIKQVKVYAKAKTKGDDTVAVKAFLIMATIVAAVGLAYLLAGLACSLSCSGAEGLAALVVIVGLTAIIIGSIKLIRAILRISKKDQPETIASLHSH